jgi:hypothetical protein
MAQNQQHEVAAPAQGDGLAQAHADLLADNALQFELPDLAPQQPPAWLEPLVRFIEFIAPFMVYVFWGGVIAAAGLVLYLIGSAILRRMPTKDEAGQAGEQPVAHYRPSAPHAQALLAEADRLAAEGRYAEAARVLLHRSIEDLERVFALQIGPSLTSREIAQLRALSRDGRDVFSLIARAVEISLFGGRALGADDYARCRSAYAAFASGGAPS